jgi:hypothetical protein
VAATQASASASSSAAAVAAAAQQPRTAVPVVGSSKNHKGNRMDFLQLDDDLLDVLRGGEGGSMGDSSSSSSSSTGADPDLVAATRRKRRDAFEHLVSNLRRDFNFKARGERQMRASQTHPDSHYKPLHPDDYVKFRTQAAIAFYKRKIPRLNRTLQVGQALLTLGSVAGVILAFSRAQAWAPVVSILVSGVTAWLEFNGSSSKLARYSRAVDELQNLVRWWQSRPTIDRSGMGNIQRLVMHCEAVLRDELNGWSSASQTRDLMLDQAEKDPSGTSKDKKSDKLD